MTTVLAQGVSRTCTDPLWDGDSEEMSQYRGLVSGKKIRSLECLWPAKDIGGMMKAVIENMDAFENVCGTPANNAGVDRCVTGDACGHNGGVGSVAVSPHLVRDSPAPGGVSAVAGACCEERGHGRGVPESTVGVRRAAGAFCAAAVEVESHVW